MQVLNRVILNSPTSYEKDLHAFGYYNALPITFSVILSQNK